jgi:unsaturated rhamnogalacturonyl hydrolase
VKAQLTEAVARAAAAHATAYPYKLWGFGEDIALRALLDLGDALGDPTYEAFVAGLVLPWARRAPPLVPTDHVAPGGVLLDLAERRKDAATLARALELGGLLTGFPVHDGVAVHRRDLEPWRDTIWVDCMALDGPFLARLARATGDAAWHDHAADALLGYARVLQDDATGLFAHGYDVGTQRPSAVRWGRGNGWALHGLVDTLDALPPDHAGAAEGRARLARLVAALRDLQHESGRWTTVLDDPTSPLEASTAAFYASGVLKARRLGLLPEALAASTNAMLERAQAALALDAGADGDLLVSDATPVGDRASYVDRPLGVFPWGEGPLVLTFIEARRATSWRTA